MNIQSIRNKLEKVKCYVQISNCDILVLTETRFKKNEVGIYTIPCYKAAHCCRIGRGGGTSLYLKIHLKFQDVTNLGGDVAYNVLGINLYELKLKLYSVRTSM